MKYRYFFSPASRELNSLRFPYFQEIKENLNFYSIRRALHLFFLLLLSFQIVKAQSLKKDLIPGSNIDYIRIQQADRVINDAIQNNEIPGAVLAIRQNGTVVYEKAYGFSDIEAKIPMNINSIFRIASMSKAITVAGVMILYERGHFMLNDPVSKYIPEFKNPQILIEADSSGAILKTEPAKKEIRIIDLLTHTSGLSYKFLPTPLQKVYENHGILDAITFQKVTLEEQIKKLASLPLLFEPGSKYQYGLSIDVLGYLCEVISGKSLEQFFTDEIFIPLKMKDTHFYLPNQKKERLVTLYSWVDGKLVESRGDESAIKIDNVRFPVEGARTYFSGGGGLCSTAGDYSRFTQMLLNNGELDGYRLLSRKSIELMTGPRVDANNDKIPEVTIGGFLTVQDIVKMGELGTNGSYIGGGAFYGNYLIDPIENLTVVFMSQVMPAKTNIANRCRVMVYQALKR